MDDQAIWNYYHGTFLPIEIRVKKPIVFNANIPNENVARMSHILIRNSQCFSSLELNRNNIYFKKKTDDLRNDR